MEENQDKNLAIQLAEDVSHFLQPMEGGDAELVRAAVDFTTEITPEQNKVLTLFEILSKDPQVNKVAQLKLKTIADAFRTRQKYFNTKGYIMDIIRSLSWRHFVETGAMNAQVKKDEIR